MTSRTTVSQSLSSSLRGTLSASILRPSWVALGLVVVLVPFVDALPPAVTYLPFVASVLVFGLPHGAVDHLAPARTAGVNVWRSMLGVGLLYLVVGGLYLCWWFLEPVSAAVFFILLTWFHWGQGDLYALLAFVDAHHLPSRVERALALVVRGGLPMVVPLVGHPVAYRRVAASFVTLFEGSPAALAPFFTPEARLLAGGGLLALTVLALTLGGWRVSRGAARQPWLVDSGELALLWVFFLLVPPVLAVGLYFTLWHALRHIARLLLVDSGSRTALTTGDLPTALWRFARDAAPLTLVSLVLLGGLAFVVPRTPAVLAGDVDGLLALYLVGIAVLTLPHVVVVSWMDRRQRVW